MKKKPLVERSQYRDLYRGLQAHTYVIKSLMKNCATAADHYYETSSGDGLKAAFRDIALKISKLRLTN